MQNQSGESKVGKKIAFKCSKGFASRGACGLLRDPIKCRSPANHFSCFPLSALVSNMLKLLVLVFAGAVLLAEGVLSQCEDGDVRLVSFSVGHI